MKDKWEREFDEKFPSAESAYLDDLDNNVHLFNPAVDVREIKDFIRHSLQQAREERDENKTDNCW